ncbi:MAG TPA: alanine racemase [Solirubrobacteraceae bacterium]
MPLRALARVNLAAIERNVTRLREVLDERTELCAVVKGDGYGHGAVHAGEAALAAGARQLAVATACEAAELRAAGIGASLLVMGAISREELPEALAAEAELVAWSEPFVEEVARAAENRAIPTAPVRVHVKLDTGMGRLGTRDPVEARRVADLVVAHEPTMALAGVMTHLATADEDPEFVAAQLDRFEPFVAELRRRWPELVVHAANSAATLTLPRSHFDLVRCGIAIYGCDPINRDPAERGLEPALELTSYVAAVKRTQPGDSAGYGRQFIAETETWIATLPIVYADGIRRAYTNNCEVLVGGRRYPLVGTVSMDNITLDLGSDTAVSVGDVATLIGVDGAERQTAEELARRIDTINYEVVCGISSRVPRAYHRDGTPV